MEGWKLNRGECRKTPVSEDELWAKFNYIFSSKSTNRTSYKFCFIKSLLENIFNADIDCLVSFDNVFEKFAETYWFLVIKHKLKQGDNGIKNNDKKTSVEKIFDQYLRNNPILSACIPFENIEQNLRARIVNDVKKECKKYVIGAIYAVTDGLLYSFDKSSEILQINPDALKFFKKYKSVLLKLNNYEWIKFLEKANKEEDAYSLAKKLDHSTKRTNLNIYRNILFEEYHKHTCFYCNRILNSTIEVDHFIPWSFLHDDKLWNFVLSCKMCNSSKSDRLTEDSYVEKLIKQNNYIIRQLTYVEIVEKEYRIYQPNKITEMYKCAELNGFRSGWKPTTVKIHG